MFRLPARPPRAELVAFFAACVCCTYAGIAAAQMPPQAGGSRATVAEDTGQTFYYLKDANNEYKFVGESLYEEYQQWYDEFRNKGGGANFPKYVIKQVDVVGKSADGFVDLDLTYKIELEKEGWFKVSLGLAGAALRAPPILSDKSSYKLEPDPSTGKYVLWLKNESGELKHLVEVKLKAAVRTETNGDQVRFNLNVSSTALFQVKLSLPPDVEATAAGSAFVTSSEQETDATVVTVESPGSSSTLQLTWGPKRRTMQDDVAVLRATGDIVATIEDDLQLKTTAKLKVTSLNGVPIESFDIRIADGAEWFPPSQTVDYQLREVYMPQGEGVEQRFIRVEFTNQLPVPTCEIELKTSQVSGSDSRESRVMAGLFDVWQAKEQEGVLRLKYSENVIASWNLRNYRRETVGDATDERAAFSYAAQPAELEIKSTTNRPTLQATSAAFQFVINGAVAQVDADFMFSVPKSYSESITFDMNGWQSVVKFKESDVDWAQVETVDDLWIAPLLTSDMERTTTARLARVSFTATFPLPMDEMGVVTLPMIRPQIAYPSAASITVRTAPNLKAIPELGADSPYQIDVLAQDENPSGQRLHLRMTPTDALPPLRLELEKIDQQLFVTPRVAIDIEPPLQALESAPLDSRCQVVQTFKLHAFYGEIGKLLLHGAPRSALADLVIRLDGEEVGYAQLQSTSEGAESALRIDVPERSTEAELTLEYKVSSPGAVLASSGELAPMITTIPLISLGAEQSSSAAVKLVIRPTELSISSHSGIQVVAPDPAWAEVRSTDSNVLLKLESVATSASAAPTAVTLEFSKRPGGISDLRTRVKRCWIQEALTSDRRRTRICFLLQTRQPSLTLHLPAEAKSFETNWKSRQISSNDRDGITLQIDPSELSRTTAMDTLEVWYDNEGKGLESSAPLEAPVLDDAVYLEPVYYQLACPSDWFCLSAPGLTEEMDWGWDGLSYIPVERLHQDRLETWSGASEQSSFSPGMSQYLYSSIGAPKSIQPWFVRRRSLMLAFGGITLAIGMGLFYLPHLRRASLVGVLVAITAAMAIFYPHHAVLFGGMASIGLACSLFSIVLYFALGTRRPARTVVRRTGSESQMRALPTEPQEPVSTTAGSALLKSSSAEA